jgi:PIN domain nuclease of toxin-antitoxin system
VRRDPALAGDPGEKGRRYLRELEQFPKEATGYQWIQGTRLQTLAFGLADSPAGLAAVLVEKFRAWTDSTGMSVVLGDDASGVVGAVGQCHFGERFGRSLQYRSPRSTPKTLRKPAPPAPASPRGERFPIIRMVWEITVKLRIGKVRADLWAITEVSKRSVFDLLNIKPDHLFGVGRLPVLADHRDPFDHLLIAQTFAEDLVFMSEDRNAPRYPVSVIKCRG